MEIIDIPEQLSTALKYSLASKRSFFLSLIAAAFVLGIAFDVLYGFFYTRAFNVKDPQYGIWFWVGIAFFAVVVPIGQGIVRIVMARRLMRPFARGTFGIAIAPFDVSSLDPDTIGAAKKFSALDEAMRQYFGSAQRAVDGVHWMDDFVFRFLPPYVKIRNKEDARKLHESLGATLIIWGEIQQQAQQPLRMAQHLLGTKLDMNISGTIDLSYCGQLLAFFALSAAGWSLQATNDFAAARAKFVLALEPAMQLDRLTKGTSSSDMTKQSIAEIDGLTVPAKPATSAPTKEGSPSGKPQ